MDRERLTALADFLETVPADRFNMGWWGLVESSLAPPQQLDMAQDACGTAACALGWACSIPEFSQAGLYLEKSSGRVGGMMAYVPRYATLSGIVPGETTTWSGYDAGAEFFDIRLAESEWLFSPDAYNPYLDDPDADPDTTWDAEVVKPAEVVARIRGLLAGTAGPDMGDD